MTPDPLEHALSTDEDLVPSFGFAKAVMDRVTREAAMPPPIPFPWRRLGLVALVTSAAVTAIASSGLAGMVAAPAAALAGRAAPRALQWLVHVEFPGSAFWAAAALAVSLVSWRLGLLLAWPRVR